MITLNKILNELNNNYMAYHSETAKVRDMPQLMKYIVGHVADVGAGNDKIIPTAVAYDGRQLEGVDIVRRDLFIDGMYDTVFSSHFLEHVPNPYEYLVNWAEHLRSEGHLVLYLPQKGEYNSHENLEHCFNWQYEDFMFFFRRCLCGEGKDYTGSHLKQRFELLDSGLDIGEDRYSFYLVARRA